MCKLFEIFRSVSVSRPAEVCPPAVVVKLSAGGAAVAPDIGGDNLEESRYVIISKKSHILIHTLHFIKMIFKRRRIFILLFYYVSFLSELCSLVTIVSNSQSAPEVRVWICLQGYDQVKQWQHDTRWVRGRKTGLLSCLSNNTKHPTHLNCQNQFSSRSLDLHAWLIGWFGNKAI